MSAEKLVSYRHAWEKAIRYGDLPTTTKAMAWALGNYMSADGWCYATDKTLAQDITASKDTVKRARRRLKQAQVLDYVSGRGKGNATEYQALIPGHLCTLLDAEGVHWRRDKGAQRARNPGTGAPPSSKEVDNKEEGARIRERQIDEPLKIRKGANPNEDVDDEVIPDAS